MGYKHFRYARRIDADNIGIYHNDMTKMLNIDKGTASNIILSGGNTTGDYLKLKANTVDTYPYIDLEGADDIECYFQPTQTFKLYDGTTEIMRISLEGTQTLFRGQAVADKDFTIIANSNDANPRLYMCGSNENIQINSSSALSSHFDLALMGDGVLCLKESATPTADTNYGKVYCKNDNKLYFQDGAGTEHEIAFTP